MPALHGKFEIKFNHLPQQARKEAQRQSPERLQIVQRQLSRFWRITAELFGLKIFRMHKAYRISVIGLPLERNALKPILEPRGRNRSVLRADASDTTPSRMHIERCLGLDHRHV